MHLLKSISRMEGLTFYVFGVILLVVSPSSPASGALSLPFFLGVAPQDEEYFSTEVIACRDGSRSFMKDRLNDGFCDCPDGTDEPGTSACPEGRFYCRNKGGTPHPLFSSRVNDNICDCCDGSDEHDSSIICPNTCPKEQNILIQSVNAVTDTRVLSYVDTLERGRELDIDDLVKNLKELKIALILELIVGMGLVSCCLLTWGPRARRIRKSNFHDDA